MKSMRRTKNGFALLPLVILTAAVIVAAGVFFGIKNKPTFVLQNINEPPAQSFGSAGSPAVQGQAFFLAGSGITSNATTVLLTSFKLSDASTTITIGMFGAGGTGFATLEPGATREENISFTGVTQNTDGTALLTGVTRGLSFSYPCSSTSGLMKSHAGGQKLVLSNSNCFYQQFVTAANDASITARYDFSSSSIPTIPSGTTFTAANQIINKSYADALAIAGAPNGSVSAKGIYQESTKAQTASGTGTGSTGADLIVPNSYFNQSSTATTTIPVTNSSGTLDTNFINQSANANYNFLGSVTFSSTTFTSYPTGLSSYFGNGSDGNVTISATTTLTRDMSYSNLTVNAQLNTGGFKIFVSGTLTGNATGSIVAPAPNNGQDSSAGGAAATSSIVGDFFNASGGAGAPSGPCNNNGSGGSSATQPATSTNSIGSTGGHSGNGAGSTSPGNGASGGATSSAAIPFANSIFGTYLFAFQNTFTPSSTAFAINWITYGQGGGGAGGGGGGGNSNAGSGLPGSGGGASGFPVFIVAKTWTGTFSIVAKGGNGGSAAGTSCNGANTPGVGGGGAGGNLVAIYQTKTYTGSVQLTGGLAGTGGNTTGATNGSSGVEWDIPINSFVLP